MAATALMTAATANGFYPDANGASPPAASSALTVGGAFGNASVIVWISDGINWNEIPGSAIRGTSVQRLQMSPDQKIRLELRDASANTSINASID